MKKYILLLIAALSAVTFPGCNSIHGNQVMYGAGELFYKDGATQDDAEKLGNYLLSVGFFDDETPHSTQLIKRGDTYVFRMSVQEDAIQNGDLERSLRFMSMDISADVFPGTKVDVELTDNDFDTKKTIPSPGVRSNQGKATIYRSFDVDAATADQVTAYLTKIGFIGNKELILSYGIQGDDFLYELITAEGAEKDKDVVEANKAIAGLLSADVLHNKPVTLHFLADDYSIKSVYPYEEIQTAYREFLADSAKSVLNP